MANGRSRRAQSASLTYSSSRDIPISKPSPPTWPRACARAVSRRWRAASSSCPRRSSGIRLTHAMRSISPTSNPGCWRSISMVWPRRRRERASTAPRILATPCSPKFANGCRRRSSPSIVSWSRRPRPACRSTPEASRPTGARVSAQYFCCRGPLFFSEQRQLVAALEERPGLDCLDLSIYSVSQFTFVARPIFPDGMTDPIQEPVILLQGRPEPGRRRRAPRGGRRTSSPSPKLRGSGTRGTPAESRTSGGSMSTPEHSRCRSSSQASRRRFGNDTRGPRRMGSASRTRSKGRSGDRYWGDDLRLEIYCAR